MCLNVKKLYKEGVYQCDTPTGRKGDSYTVDTWQKCGHCIECANEKANNWLVRNYYEQQAHDEKCFITLTYAKNPYVLIKKDLQDFIKRLRFHLSKQNIKIRYFGCGEYGTLKGRPHMHLIIYGWEDKKAKFKEWNKKGNAIFESELITKTWGKGITSYQEFNEKEIAYVSLYTSCNENNYKPKLKINQLREMLINEKNRQKQILLEKQIIELEEKKQEYYAVKEFCVWSEALGWDKWSQEYDGETWTEYINDKEFLTPSPWIKKIATMGDYNAIKELIRRKEFEIDRAETVESRTTFKTRNAIDNDNKKILKWQKEKQIKEDF